MATFLNTVKNAAATIANAARPTLSVLANLAKPLIQFLCTESLLYILTEDGRKILIEPTPGGIYTNEPKV